MPAGATIPPDVMRGVAGGVLLGTPLVYTQEVWTIGASVTPFILIAILVVGLGLNVVLSYFVGFRSGRTHRPIEDSVIGFGLSVILSTLLLLLLGRIGLSMPFDNALGIVALTTVPVSIGFALGAALAPKRGGARSETIPGGTGELLVAAAGALVFSFNIAPTEEPLILGAEVGWLRLVLIGGASLLLPYLMVFYAEFQGRHERRSSSGATQGPAAETFLAYLVAFIVSGILLGAFGRWEGHAGSTLAEVVVLAFPASLGAALGRMLV